MKQPDMELTSLRSELDAARRDVGRAKEQLDQLIPQRNAYRSQLQYANASIADLKTHIASEQDAIRICRQARDLIGAKNHFVSLQSYQFSLKKQYSIKNDCLSRMAMGQSDLSAALSTYRAARERWQQALEAHRARLGQLKAQRAKDAIKMEGNCM